MHDYKVTIFLITILLSLGLLGTRLFGLQIVGRGHHQEIARGNALRTLRVMPARGAIYDRHGVLLVHNEPSYTVTLTPRFFDESKAPLLAEHLGVDAAVVRAKLDEARRWTSYRPSRSFTNVPYEQYSHIQEDRFLLPGVDKIISQRRHYTLVARASHALGYVNEITREELGTGPIKGGSPLCDSLVQATFTQRAELATAPAATSYRQGDILGRTGVEQTYESCLRGIPGSALRVVNVHGLEVKSYLEGKGDRVPTSGYDIHLALDAGVQALAESLFISKRGAAVVLDTDTGGIITLLSAPDFDPTLFSGGIDPEHWQTIRSHPDKPLYNRASMNQMPPGSTWKPFMALMALDTGIIDTAGTNSVVYCGGGHPIGRGRIFKCLGRHGSQNAMQAIQNSCNTFFFEVARRMEINTFRRYANMFGFGLHAPTDIPVQTPGLIPDSAYFKRTYVQWGTGTVMNLGVGQGDMGVTPLQLARYIAAVGNGGYLPEPHLVSYLANPATGDTIRVAPRSVHIPIDSSYLSIARRGLRLVMEAGSGRMAQIPGIPSGGKTGTAQAPGGMQDHSVFVMFAPYDDPRIAVAVQCENAGGGSRCAAPIASLLAERYLKGHLPDSPQVAFRMNRAQNASSEPLPPQ